SGCAALAPIRPLADTRIVAVVSGPPLVARELHAALAATINGRNAGRPMREMYAAPRLTRPLRFVDETREDRERVDRCDGVHIERYKSLDDGMRCREKTELVCRCRRSGSFLTGTTRDARAVVRSGQMLPLQHHEDF